MHHDSHTRLPDRNRKDWQTIKSLLPYLWRHKKRIYIALVLLAIAKLANIGVPVVLKNIVDYLDSSQSLTTVAVGIPLALLIGYGLLRLSTSLFQELRNAVFARASEQSVREVALAIFQHLHKLPLRFHLDRQTGGLSRDLERGSRSISRLLHILVFNITPTIFEISVVCLILLVMFDVWFAVVTFSTVVLYFVYTWKVTDWRTKFRVKMNEMDSLANTVAIDSLLNYETVKYFNNEKFESKRYDNHLKEWQKASIKTQITLALLNIGQGVIIGIGLTVLLIMAASAVINQTMTLGEFVMVNAFLIQLYMPLNFLGTVFREVNHYLTDMGKMFALLDVPSDTSDKDSSQLVITNGEVKFDNVCFSYNPDRPILNKISFDLSAGKKVALVGASGSGKSTLARLLYRFYPVNQGAILIDGQDITEVNLDSLRKNIGIAPQDTVLFNDTIEFNIHYGAPGATLDEVKDVAKLAHLEDFIRRLPDGYQTMVGERGLKLSGGEKQRIAIARTLLKNPSILILDEATSALDSHSEQIIQRALQSVMKNRTMLVIAHRLSTIIDADNILVMDQGKIVESGNHSHLLEYNGLYAQMWALQQHDEESHI